jgi:hypothetical protein
MELTAFAPDTGNRSGQRSDTASSKLGDVADQRLQAVADPVGKDFVSKRQLTASKTVMRLGEILQRRQLVVTEQLQQVLQIQANCSGKIRLGELMVACDLITRLDLQRALMEQDWRRQGLWVID